ncbi:MAG: aminopeptidase P family protein [Gemmatimonadaceae bacterium]|nr:aminopeptidase P family protein [Gemmatimonadaceae bacterium]
MREPHRLSEIQAALRAARLDGWLLYEFKGCNPIASGLLGFEGLSSRRAVAWLPAEGTPVALMHAIELDSWRKWPATWERRIYQSWQSLEGEIRALVQGKRVAMEYSPGDAVPYLDRVPGGVLDLVRACGATVETSAELVTRFYALLTEAQLAAHCRAAEALAVIGPAALQRAATAARAGTPLTEYAVQQWIMGEFASRGLVTTHPCNVSVGANAANPHYEPHADGSALVTMDSVLLIDLWAGEPGQPYADQTWMATIGTPADPDVLPVWEAIRDARDAAIRVVRDGFAAGLTVRGADVDDAARAVITARGFGAAFTHRTGHSIDVRDLHGSGPHMDGFETREERHLLPGVLFSVEPGVYLAGRFGMRTEVNVAVTLAGTVLVTPDTMQADLFRL